MQNYDNLPLHLLLPNEGFNVEIHTAVSVGRAYGGYGIVFVYKNSAGEALHRVDYQGTSPTTYAWTAEVTAACVALTELIGQPVNKITLFSSPNIVTGITEWIHLWMANGWRNQQGKRVSDKELWLQFFKLSNDLKAQHLSSKLRGSRCFEVRLAKALAAGANDKVDNLLIDA